MSSAPPRTSSTRIVLWAGLAVVVIAAVVAIIASNTSDSKTVVALPAVSGTAGTAATTGPGLTTDSAGTAATTGPGLATVAETQPITVTGHALVTLPDSGADPAVNTIAPALAGKSFAGAPVSITPGKDGKLMVVFLAHWCPHCQREVPRIVQWMASPDAPKDVKVVAVATSTTSDRPNFPPSAWLAKENWKAPVIADTSDGAAAQAFGLSGFPFIALIDASGKVVARNAGELTVADLNKFVHAHLG